MKQVPIPLAIGLLLGVVVIAGFFLFQALQPPDVSAALKARARVTEEQKARVEQRFGSYRNAGKTEEHKASTP